MLNRDRPPRYVRAGRARIGFAILTLGFAGALMLTSNVAHDARARDRHEFEQRIADDERVAKQRADDLAAQNDQRRIDGCRSRQALYDGQIFLAEFIGEKAHASPQEIAADLAELKTKLKGRPVC